MASTSHALSRRILLSLPAALAIQEGRAITLTPDPVLPAIAAHKRAWAAFEDACPTGVTVSPDEAAREAAASDADWQAWLDVLDARPTTLGGALALARHARWYGGSCGGWEAHEQGLDALVDALAALLRPSGAPA